MTSNRHPKFIAVDKQPDDSVMHLDQFGKANRLTRQTLDIRSAWETALKHAGIPDFRFHDLRHSAVSYLAMSSASLAEIAEVLGHKTLTMVKDMST